MWFQKKPPKRIYKQLIVAMCGTGARITRAIQSHHHLKPSEWGSNKFSSQAPQAMPRWILQMAVGRFQLLKGQWGQDYTAPDNFGGPVCSLLSSRVSSCTVETTTPISPKRHLKQNTRPEWSGFSSQVPSADSTGKHLKADRAACREGLYCTARAR